MCFSGISWDDFPWKRLEGSSRSSGPVLHNLTWLSPTLFFQAVFSQKEDWKIFIIFFRAGRAEWRKDITAGYSLCFHVKGRDIHIKIAHVCPLRVTLRVASSRAEPVPHSALSQAADWRKACGPPQEWAAWLLLLHSHHPRSTTKYSQQGVKQNAANNASLIFLSFPSSSHVLLFLSWAK